MSTTSTSRNRNLLVIIAVLLLTNIAVLGYFLWYKKEEKPQHTENKERNGIADPLKKEVGFNEEQLAAYVVLRDKQRGVIRPMFDEMRKSKDTLFRLLSDPNTSDSVLNIVTDGIAQKQKALDLQTFHHFKRVRAICTPEQQSKYDSLIVKMFRKMGRPKSEAEKTEKTDKPK